MSARKLDAPESRALIDIDDDAKATLTEAEAHVLERDVAKVGRAYCRAHARVRKLRAALKKALAAEKALRREMRMLISVRRK